MDLFVSVLRIALVVFVAAVVWFTLAVGLYQLLREQLRDVRFAFPKPQADGAQRERRRIVGLIGRQS